MPWDVLKLHIMGRGNVVGYIGRGDVMVCCNICIRVDVVYATRAEERGWGSQLAQNGLFYS